MTNVIREDGCWTNSMECVWIKYHEVTLKSTLFVPDTIILSIANE